jgi:ABC-type taurine transport system substrate-binding protein
MARLSPSIATTRHLPNTLPGSTPSTPAGTVAEEDRAGRYPEFIEHFHKLLAAARTPCAARRENFWSGEQPCVVKLVGRDAVLDKLVYTPTNLVADHLVDRAHHWPGGVP